MRAASRHSVSLPRPSGRSVMDTALRSLQSRFQIRIADLVEAVDELAGGWIDALQLHATAPFQV
jgi:hypothetical protein